MGSAKQGKTSSSNWSEALSNSWNQAFNVNQSQQGSQSRNYGSSSQNVWGPQADALGGLYGQANQLASGQGAMAGASADVSQQARNAWSQALQPGGNPYFQQNVQGAIDQATQSFNRSVLPGLTDQGVGAGAYGTSRDALARGEAAGLAQQGIQNMVGGMYANQYATDQAMRNNALAMTNQMQQSVTNPLTTAAGIVGGPTVIGGSEQMGESTSYGDSYGVGSSMGGSLSSAESAGKGSGKDQGLAVGGK